MARNKNRLLLTLEEVKAQCLNQDQRFNYLSGMIIGQIIHICVQTCIIHGYDECCSMAIIITLHRLLRGRFWSKKKKNIKGT